MVLVFSFPLFAQDFLSTTLKELSHDKMEGRKAGSAGGKLASNYLEKKLKELKIAPFGSSHRQEFTIFTKMKKFGSNELRVASGAVAPFEPLAFSNSGELKSQQIVFAGFGISLKDKSFEYDDYKGLDVKGKVVILLTGDPGIGNLKSLFRNPKYIKYRSIFYKIKNAARLGASAVLMVQNPMSIKDLKREAAPFFNESEGGGESFNILTGLVKNSWVGSLLPKGITTLSLQKGLSSSQKPDSFVIKDLLVNLSIHLKKQTGRVANIVGFIPGSDSSLKDVLVLGAHMDHLGFGGHTSMDNPHIKKIHNGADDNASGTAVVLELAKRLSLKKSKRSVIIAFFHAEEMGLLGSAHFVSSYPRYKDAYGGILGMLNFDMVGRFQDKLSVMGIGSAFEWQTHIDKIISVIKSSKVGGSLLPLSLQNSSVGSSDHASFIQNGYPALFFTTGAHEDYHRASDDFDKLDISSLRKVAFLSEKIVSYFEDSKSLIFDPDSKDSGDAGRARGYGSHLGCVPKFGGGDEIKGVKCVRISKGSPAEKAKVLPGDIIIGLGEIEIASLYDLAFALKYYRPGDEIELTWKRKGKIIKEKLKLIEKKH